MDRLLVKVCGQTTREGAELCAGLGADMLGFIFHPASPRNVEPALPASLDLPGVLKVGVFVAQTVAEILAVMRAGRLHAAQLHGGARRLADAPLGRRLDRFTRAGHGVVLVNGIGHSTTLVC